MFSHFGRVFGRHNQSEKSEVVSSLPPINLLCQTVVRLCPAVCPFLGTDCFPVLVRLVWISDQILSDDSDLVAALRWFKVKKKCLNFLNFLFLIVPDNDHDTGKD